MAGGCLAATQLACHGHDLHTVMPYLHDTCALDRVEASVRVSWRLNVPTCSRHILTEPCFTPPQVTLQTERATLARLAKASMCTGYQLSNAEMRLLLERGAGAGACDSTSAYDAGVEGEPRLSAGERSGLSPAAAAHVAALEARLRRLEAQCGAGGAAEQVGQM